MLHGAVGKSAGGLLRFSVILAPMLVTGCADKVDMRYTPPPPVVAAPPRAEPPLAAAADPAHVPAAPAVRRVELGRSVRGQPLTLEIFGSGPERVFIFGGIHGSEPASAELARLLAEHLRTHPDLLEGRTVGVLAVANPDGLAAGTRHNAARVDLNRNFPARTWRPAGGRRASHGPAAGSEPETAAIIRAVHMLQPERILSLHAISRGRHCNNYDGPGHDIAALMGRQNAYPVRATIGYATPGSFGSWAGVDRGIPTITLELPADVDGTAAWRDNRTALLAFIAAG